MLMRKSDFDEERIDRWRRRAGAIPGRSWSTRVADNIRAGARLREDIFERGVAAARRALREYHASKERQS
jgi:hypothetical protein